MSLSALNEHKHIQDYHIHSISHHIFSEDTAWGYDLDGRDSIPGRSNVFLFSIAFKPTLESTQPRIRWIPGLYGGTEGRNA
jgi:cystathionine beta-lyase family protein involved in aluminum resistance